jgi:hypothetical protein
MPPLLNGNVVTTTLTRESYSQSFWRTLAVGLIATAFSACSSDDHTGAQTDAGSDADVAELTDTAGPDARPDTDLVADIADTATSLVWTAPMGPHVLGDRAGAVANTWAAPWPDEHRGPLVPANPNQTRLVDELIALQPELAGTTSAVYFPTTHAIDPASLPADAAVVMAGGGSVEVTIASGSRAGERLRANVGVLGAAGPHAPTHAIVVQPVQGWPWPVDTDIEVVIRTAVRTVDGEALAASGWPLDAARADAGEVAAVARLRTQDPTTEFTRAVADVRDNARLQPEWTRTPEPTETWDGFCVWEGQVEFTQFQQGVYPFETGGAWAFDDGRLVDAPRVRSRVWFSVPDEVSPAGGWPVMQFSRVGGGGDRPMLDRGVRDAGGNADAGTGLAGTFARAGWAGLQFDGPHGGERNPTRGNEQFLMFNINNPIALRDNVRQTALELAVLGEWLVANAPAMSCGEIDPATLSSRRQGLFGHSMSATVAPLAAAAMPELELLVLSGAGGSWVENVLHKLRPVPTRPIAEALLGYSAGQLTELDPVLNLLQAGGEAADPQAYAYLLAARADLDILMFQGIADTYILPPIANALSLPLGLTLGGDAIEDQEPESAAFTPYLAMDPWADPPQAELPLDGDGGRLAVLVQHREDGIEDGHEVAFQRGDARRQIRCFLADGIVVAAGDEALPCE